MERPSGNASDVSAGAAEQTRQCLADMDSKWKNYGKRTGLIIIIGRTGAGKSSLFEDLTDLEGHSQQSADSVTENFAIGKASIDTQDYYIMDTPGFNPGNEKRVFLEIVSGIQATRDFADVVGILYVTCINQPRFDDFDRKLTRFTNAMCGEKFLPRLTLVTTFWTAPGEKQKSSFDKQLISLQGKWDSVFVGQRYSLYQHGRQYEDKSDTGNCLDWFEKREDIAKHAKDVVFLPYNTEREDKHISHPVIIQELAASTAPENTSAGKLLGLCVVEGENGNMPSHRMPAPEGRSDTNQNSRPDSRYRDPATESQATSAVQSQIDWWLVARKGLELVGRLMERTEFSISPAPSSSTMGNAYHGPLDPHSAVDVMKSYGLDSSREGRLDYATSRGIQGQPFSAAWNESIRQSVLNGGR